MILPHFLTLLSGSTFCMPRSTDHVRYMQRPIVPRDGLCPGVQPSDPSTASKSSFPADSAKKQLKAKGTAHPCRVTDRAALRTPRTGCSAGEQIVPVRHR